MRKKLNLSGNVTLVKLEEKQCIYLTDCQKNSAFIQGETQVVLLQKAYSCNPPSVSSAAIGPER